MDKNKFGNFIKEKRLENKLTQKELADKLMIDVTAVSKWERGINYPDITMIPAICGCLGINEHELIESSTDTELRAIKSDAQKYNRIKNTIFYSFSAAYALSIIVCFIVNIAVDKGLSWFFVEAASCLCAFTFIPTCTRFFERGKLGIFLGSTLLSLFLLYLTCCIYTGGHWLWIAFSGTVLGYFVFFYPVLFKHQSRYIGEEKYESISKYLFITYTAGIILLTFILLLCVAATVNYDLLLALKCAGYCFILPLIWGIVELIPVKRIFRLSLDSLFTGAHLYGLNGVLNKLLEGGSGWYQINFSDWENFTDGNVAIIGLAFFVLLAAVFAVFGFCRKK